MQLPSASKFSFIQHEIDIRFKSKKVYLKRVYEYSLIKQIKFILGWAVPLGSEAILFSINIDDIH